MQKPATFQKDSFLFFSTFTRFHAALLQNFLSYLRATYTLNCTEKTLCKKTSFRATDATTKPSNQEDKKEGIFIYLLQNNATRKNDDKIKTKRLKRKLWLKAQIANRIRAQKC
jgi:hypothetical protein